MGAFLPIVSRQTPIDVVDSIVAITVLLVLAGLTNPKQKWTAYANVIVATIGAGVLEYYAIDAYRSHSGGAIFFWVNQALAVTFILALYYATKTLRGMYIKTSPDDIDPLEPKRREEVPEP